MKWIDMHCDTLSEIVKIKETDRNTAESLYRNHLCVDAERLRQTDSAAQFFACYVNAAEYGDKDMKMICERKLPVRRDDSGRWDTAYEAVLKMIGEAYCEAGQTLVFAKAGEELCSSELRTPEKEAGASAKKRTAAKAERTAGILTVEEGGVLNGRLSRLDELHEKGVRLVTLTWNYENCIGYPNSRDRNIMEKGLTDFGIQTVERMNELGMIVDVSHLSDGGFWDCMKYSRYPVAASHSNSRSLCRHPRNLSDEMLRALGEKGGVAGVNFYSEFLRERRGKSDGGRASADDIADHALWMIDKAGEDAVALGTDLDGFDPDSLPAGIQGVQDIGRVWDAMRRKGITPRQLDKIAYGNAMRVMQEVWK
ncbi:MAG TPA: membrane dipeptidase [Candidatus Mediterraneibacter faecavium]|uniref:Membrane dipeptidase n=1 Tax=Candidatus Mediterraneibacter faecavium TaxID=2838668 RepID=A0A9D2QBR0_9FIRM|nr:membrane dipeptidase [Candidatus Mediterraneibacter faecavium]